jgi:hypothetical protein
MIAVHCVIRMFGFMRWRAARAIAILHIAKGHCAGLHRKV